jgi:hypothetical protein
MERKEIIDLTSLRIIKEASRNYQLFYWTFLLIGLALIIFFFGKR